MRAPLLLVPVLGAGLAALLARGEAPASAGSAAPPLFRAADSCSACHNGLTGPGGEEVSFGLLWRPTMMANASRDPYWQATVRRESGEHPEHAVDIEDECATCHMPMTTLQAHAAGRKGALFAALATPLGADSVSCSVCHQIADKDLGARHTLTGKFSVDTTKAGAQRRVFGPYRVEPGLAATMRSTAGFTPVEAGHIQRAELCASCHTLITKALGPKGEVVGELPEQVPYLEWLASAHRAERSCQSCHMPALAEPARVASVLGGPRPHLSRHSFVGGNFLVPRLLGLLAGPQGVVALPQDLDGAARRALDHLAGETARISIGEVRREAGRILAEVTVVSLAGHKLPTAYPSRRVWLHVALRDEKGFAVFESGAIDAAGRIAGNDNDDDPARFEPHRDLIAAPEEVQIWEAIMVDSAGAVTTRLLGGVSFAKDNRILPRGLDKAGAAAEIAVRGEALADDDFLAGGDRVGLSLPSPMGPHRLEVELRYQPIGYRWAESFRDANSPEAARFLDAFARVSSASSAVLARAEVIVD